MPQNHGLYAYDERHARWQAMVGSWRCSYCDCHDHARTVLNPVCTRCKHIHLLPARDRQPPASAPRTRGGTPLFDRSTGQPEPQKESA